MMSESLLPSYSLAALIDGNPVPCFVIDREHVVTHWNSACEQVLGLSAAQMVGTRDAWRAFYPTPRATMADLIVEGSISEIIDGLYWNKRVRRSTVVKDAYEAEDFFPHMGQGGRWLFFTASPIRNELGEVIGAVETLQDITAQRLAELALRETNEQLEAKVAQRTAELAESNRQLAESLRQSEAASRMKSTFLASISHELKTPLNSIIGFADLIALDPQDEAVESYARLIHNSGKTLYELVASLITLAEIEGGLARPTIAPYEPTELMINHAERFRSQAKAKGLGFSVHVDVSTPEVVEGDSARVLQMVGNVLDNAIKFTEQGEVSLEVTGAGGALVIRVRDTGPGIPVAAQSTIFEKFRQLADSPTRQHGGIGLGLALARAQAELCGGRLTLESSTPAGSVFTLCLPPVCAFAQA